MQKLICPVKAISCHPLRVHKSFRSSTHEASAVKRRLFLQRGNNPCEAKFTEGRKEDSALARTCTDTQFETKLLFETCSVFTVMCWYTVPFQATVWDLFSVYSHMLIHSSRPSYCLRPVQCLQSCADTQFHSKLLFETCSVFTVICWYTVPFQATVWDLFSVYSHVLIHSSSPRYCLRPIRCS
jgi:hypothetical protein